MREKLLNLMKNEGLKPSQLAEMLEINPAAISHLLAGRNKPRYDLLQKILRRFPHIDSDWLMLDSPQMYRADSAHSATMFPSINGGANGVDGGALDSAINGNGNGLPRYGGSMQSGGQSGRLTSASNPSVDDSGGFAGNMAGNIGATRDANGGIGQNNGFVGGSSNGFSSNNNNSSSFGGNVDAFATIGSALGFGTTSVAKIVIFYTDNTFESYTPRHD